MTRPPVTIVIPVWNAVEVTGNCLTALRGTLGPDDQVVVVDNGSRDKTPDLLAAQSWLEVVTLETNEGFAGGCNAGARQARNSLLVFLNNDTLPTPGWIEGLVAPFVDPRVGATGPVSNVVSGPQLRADAGYRPQNLTDIAAYAETVRRHAAGRQRETDRLVGFCLAVRTSVFDQIGGFDESFGLGGCEDDDLCNRLRSAGWRLVIAEDTFVHHVGHQTFDENHVDWFALQQDNLKKLQHKWATTAPVSFVVMCGREPLPLIGTLVGIEQTMGKVPFEVVLLIPDRAPLAEVLAGVSGVHVVDVPDLPEDQAWQIGYHVATGLRKATVRAGEAVDVAAVQRLIDTNPRRAVPTAVGALPEAAGPTGSRAQPRMSRHDFLTELHRILEPKLYLETGVQLGLSLRLAKPGTRAIGVDPQPRVTSLPANAEVYATTSDDFFATNPAKLGLNREGLVDLGFVDGMHLFEYALRDFANIARLAHPGTVVVFDDVLPRNHVEASRQPNPGDWAGDVWKVEPILRQLRPDLTLTLVDTEPTGVLVVHGLSAADTTLLGECSSVPMAWLDKPVPDAVLTRRAAISPAQALKTIEAWKSSLDVRAPGGRELYLDLMQKVLLNTIYEDPAQDPWSEKRFDAAKREGGLDWPAQAHTMIGRRRMTSLREAVESVLTRQVPGDLIETGVWRGGACIYMRAILKAYGVTDRRVFVADSFEGLPAPDPGRYPADTGDVHHTYDPLAVSLDEVKDNFAKYDLLDEQVVFLPGWFKDTLADAPIGQLAVLRLDGDMYESTMDALVALYDKVSPGGFVIVDDFALPACERAVLDFRRERRIEEPIVDIDSVGAYWQKTELVLAGR